MNGEDFPYSQKNFKDSDNKKLAGMIEWEHNNLYKYIKSNRKALNKHDDRISEIEDELLSNQVKIDYYKTVRNYILEIISVAGVFGVFLITAIKFILG